VVLQERVAPTERRLAVAFVGVAVIVGRRREVGGGERRLAEGRPAVGLPTGPPLPFPQAQNFDHQQNNKTPDAHSTP